jgi:outer membrane protein assembly factor BamB
MLFGDRVHQSMSIAGGLIFSIEGKRVTKDAAAQTAPQSRGPQWGVTPRRTRTNWLAAYEVRSGKAKWHRAASDEDKDSSQDVGFLAAPVPFGNLLLAPVTDGGSIWLYALSAADGATVWKSYLCDEPQGGCSPWSPVYVAVDGRDAYVTCGAGVVFAVDAVSGAVRWAVRYQRSGKPNAGAQQHGYQIGMLDLSGWDDDMVIPYGRTLVVLASDCDKLFAIDRRSGKFLWDSPRREAEYCLGVNGRGLFVAGQHVARRYDIPTGLLVWDKEIGDSFGRGALTGDAVYLPVKDSILKLDLAKGAEMAHVGVSLTTDDPVGNLYSDGEKLWATGAGRVYAMTNLEHRLSILEKQIAAGDAEAQLNRMRLYAKQKKLEPMLDDSRAAFALIRGQTSADDAAVRVMAAVNDLKLPQQQPVAVLTLAAELFGPEELRSTLAPEVRSRCASLVANALTSVRQTRPTGGVTAILAVAPLLEQDYLVTLAARALEAAAQPSDQEELLAALQTDSPISQAMAAGALAKIAPAVARQHYARLAKSKDDRVRLTAARGMLNQGDRTAFTALLALLDSDNPRIRSRSHQTLRSVSGEPIAFASEAKAEERGKTVAAWKAWIEKEGPTAKLALPLSDTDTLLGRTLYVSHVHSMVRELDAEHNERWSIKVPNPWGCQGLPNGHRLIAAYSQNMVIEYDDEGKEVWKKDRLPSPPYSVERLENGNTLVACADVQQVLEISPDGGVTSQTVQGRPMCARRLENGNTLVALQQNNRVVELDPNQKVVWEAGNLNGPSWAQRLENGNTLIAQMYNGTVVEVDATGKKIVWQTRVVLTNPCCAQRLPSGNTLITDNNGVHELDAEGQKVIWQVRQNNVTSVSQF